MNDADVEYGRVVSACHHYMVTCLVEAKEFLGLSVDVFKKCEIFSCFKTHKRWSDGGFAVDSYFECEHYAYQILNYFDSHCFDVMVWKTVKDRDNEVDTLASVEVDPHHLLNHDELVQKFVKLYAEADMG